MGGTGTHTPTLCSVHVVAMYISEKHIYLSMGDNLTNDWRQGKSSVLSHSMHQQYYKYTHTHTRVHPQAAHQCNLSSIYTVTFQTNMASWSNKHTYIQTCIIVLHAPDSFNTSFLFIPLFSISVEIDRVNIKLIWNMFVLEPVITVLHHLIFPKTLWNLVWDHASPQELQITFLHYWFICWTLPQSINQSINHLLIVWG